MRLLHRVFALMLAALWLLAVVHCGLEAIEETSGASSCCCSHDEGGAANAGGACLSDHCGLFDDGHFRTEQDASSLSGELLLVAFSPVDARLAPEPGDLRTGARAGRPPPEGWSRRWMFELRAAPLANAPGLMAG